MEEETTVNILLTISGPLTLEQRCVIAFHIQSIIENVGDGRGKVE